MGKIAIMGISRNTDTDFTCTGIHWCPFDSVNGLGKTEAELTQEGMILVDSIPEATPVSGKDTVLHINPITLNMWYVYVNRELTPEEANAELKQRISDLEMAMAAMIGGAV